MNTELETIPFNGTTLENLQELLQGAIERGYKIIKPTREDYHWFHIVAKSESTGRDMLINVSTSWPWGMWFSLTHYPHHTYGSGQLLIHKDENWSFDKIEEAINRADNIISRLLYKNKGPTFYKNAEEYLTPDKKYGHIWYEYELFNF